MLSFSDHELDRLTAAAGLLPANRRDMFLRSIGNMLGGLHHEPTAADLEHAIRDTLNAYGIGGGVGFSSRRVNRNTEAQQAAERLFHQVSRRSSA